MSAKKQKHLSSKASGKTQEGTNGNEPVSGTLRSSLRLNPRSTQFAQFSSPSGESSQATSELSGDLEGLETDDREGFESVSELAAEGQDLEATLLEGVENALDPDQGEMKPRDVPDVSVPRKFEDRNRI